ncbi:hypothetical protein ACFE04_014081 [Oxalis oulophora]
MGNGIGKFTVCFNGDRKQHNDNIASFYNYTTDPLDEGLGHSFVYVRPDPNRLSSSKVHSQQDESTTTTTFRTISGASVSANTSTPLSTDSSLYMYNSFDKAAAFESSNSFASIPLQPIPRGMMSGPLLDGGGYLSGPIERGFMSGPIERGLFSGPIGIERSFSHTGLDHLNFNVIRGRSLKRSLVRAYRKAKTMVSFQNSNSMVAPISKATTVTVKEQDWGFSISDKEKKNHIDNNLTVSSLNLSSEGSLDDDEDNQNLQWAQGKAGEDRVHVVVSEEHGWVYVGIYDGFNGPDAPDFLLTNLYSAVHKELKGLLWDDDNKFESGDVSVTQSPVVSDLRSGDVVSNVESEMIRSLQCFEQENYPCSTGSVNSEPKRRKSSKSKYKGAAKKWEENQRKWRIEWDRERQELDRRLKEQLNKTRSDGFTNHGDVLKALSQALKKTEEAYFDVADKMLMDNPELALMGSCVLVMLMKGEDVYVMNVGDSRAVLGQKAEPDYWLGKIRQDLERINEETLHDLEGCDGDRPNGLNTLNAFQLSADHSTSVEEEVQRIRNEHPDDSCSVMNDRVKGSLKVTRAFGAGFLKERLGPKDRFLILSSDGLYQYFTNEEAVSEVELFITLQPEGDPAQHLVEEVHGLSRVTRNTTR